MSRENQTTSVEHYNSEKKNKLLCSTIQNDIGQLPRVSTEDRVVSAFETHVLCSLIVSKFSHFSLFHPSLFIQYSTEECSTVQYKAKLGAGP